MPHRMFQNTWGNHNKFYEVVWDPFSRDEEVRVRWGRIGTKGQSKTYRGGYEFRKASGQKAASEAEFARWRIAKLLGSGYEEVELGAVPSSTRSTPRRAPIPPPPPPPPVEDSRLVNLRAEEHLIMSETQFTALKEALFDDERPRIKRVVNPRHTGTEDYWDVFLLPPPPTDEVEVSERFSMLELDD